MKKKLPEIPFRALVRGRETMITGATWYGRVRMYRTEGMGLVQAEAITPIAVSPAWRVKRTPLDDYEAERARPDFEAWASQPRKKMWPDPDEGSSSKLSGPRAFFRERTQRTRRWLERILEAGPKPAREILLQAKADGVPERSLRRAKKSLGVKAFKRGGRKGRDGAVWFWQQEQSQDCR